MKYLIVVFLINVLKLERTTSYSATRDAKIIAEFKLQQEQYGDQELDHAKIARTIVSQSNWASVGTISTNEIIRDYPMVNIIATDDRNSKGVSTGKIHFMLTDLDFTGPDWKNNNKVTFMFSEDQTLNCKIQHEDPMEPTCARVMISGQVKQFDRNDKNYDDALVAFVERHPAAKNWINAHAFYLCELDIKNVFVLDYYGGPHNITPDEYYNIKL